jgi:hypothetical protein
MMKKSPYRLAAIAVFVFFSILAVTDSFEGQIPVNAPGCAFLSDPGDPECANQGQDIQGLAHFHRPGSPGGVFSCRPFVLPDDSALIQFRAVIPPSAMRAPPGRVLSAFFCA